MPSAEPQADPFQKRDWSSIKDEILCPLCDYNLRGLEKPQCPECGYKFAWHDVLDPARRPHPYIFEHHPSRSFWALWKTLAGGLSPRGFWRTLNPAQRVRPGRLAIYALVTMFFGLSFCVILDSVAMFQFSRMMQAQRTMMATWVTRSGVLPASMTPQKFLDMKYPLFGSPVFFQRFHELNGTTSLTFVGWPIATFVVLQIFSASMRKARIHKAHVLRCVIYSFDFYFWCAVTAFVLLIIWMASRPSPGLAGSWALRGRGFWQEGLLLILGILLCYRLGVAYRDYLKFDHPFLTIVSSQFILLLTYFCLNIPVVFRIYSMVDYLLRR